MMTAIATESPALFALLCLAAACDLAGYEGDLDDLETAQDPTQAADNAAMSYADGQLTLCGAS